MLGLAAPVCAIAPGRADSPRLHADKISVPVLLVHGAEDYTVEPDHSQLMARALQTAGKSYKLVVIDGTDHYFQNQADQRQLFTAITEFLRPLLAAP